MSHALAVPFKFSTVSKLVRLPGIGSPSSLHSSESSDPLQLNSSTSGKRAPLRANGKRFGIHDSCEGGKHEFFDRSKYNVAGVGVYTRFIVIYGFWWCNRLGIIQIRCDRLVTIQIRCKGRSLHSF